MKYPSCQQEVSDIVACDTEQPFTAHNPWDGLNAWAPADVPKELLHVSGQWAHIRFLDAGGGDRLVRMLRA